MKGTSQASAAAKNKLGRQRIAPKVKSIVHELTATLSAPSGNYKQQALSLDVVIPPSAQPSTAFLPRLENVHRFSQIVCQKPYIIPVKVVGQQAFLPFYFLF